MGGKSRNVYLLILFSSSLLPQNKDEMQYIAEIANRAAVWIAVDDIENEGTWTNSNTGICTVVYGYLLLYSFFFPCLQL